MISLNARRYIKALSIITLGFAVFVGLGVLVTRVTVHDVVEVPSSLRNCVTVGLGIHYDNPFERIGMYLGKSRIVSANATSAEIESFTIYHIPLGVFRGSPRMKTSINCSFALGEGSVSSFTDYKLGQYVNKELGISMEIPLDKNEDQLIGEAGKGDTGMFTQVTINLPSGSVIYGYSATKDYSVSKGSPGVGQEGYVVKDGKYYIVTRGTASEVEFVPDDIWKTNDGSSVLVRYRKDYEKYIDYLVPAIQVYVNIPNSIFTGLGFIIVGSEANQYQLSDADIQALKKAVNTIKYI